ncbi:hypothetical protein NL472_28365, partial [Klebsiella pneumoniae]|nr:hypothetical protein [Klebsiella pneumoniae]
TQATATQATATQAQEEREQIAGAQQDEDRGGSIVEAGHLAGKTDDDASSLFKAFASDERVQVQGLGVRGAPAAQATP